MINVLKYDPTWESHFCVLSSMIRKATWSDIVIEHVGSTSVSGLAAKPIIDIDVIVSRGEVGTVIERLAKIGYQHRGNLGIEDREAFFHPEHIDIEHHLYVCVEGSVAVRNHLALRDHLRAHPESAERYGRLKMELARKFPDDMDSYVSGKTSLIIEILGQCGMTTADIASIEDANRIK